MLQFAHLLFLTLLGKKKKYRELIIQNKIEILSIFIAFVAFLLSSFTFYYQFLYVKNEAYVTPITYDVRKNDQNEEYLFYEFIFTNSGNEPINVIHAQASVHTLETVDGNSPFIPFYYQPNSPINKEALMSKESLSISFNIPIKYFESSRHPSELLKFNFYILDGFGKPNYLILDACVKPVINVDSVHPAYEILNIDLIPISSCNKGFCAHSLEKSH